MCHSTNWLYNYSFRSLLQTSFIHLTISVLILIGKFEIPPFKVFLFLFFTCLLCAVKFSELFVMFFNYGEFFEEKVKKKSYLIQNKVT